MDASEADLVGATLRKCEDANCGEGVLAVEEGGVTYDKISANDISLPTVSLRSTEGARLRVHLEDQGRNRAATTTNYSVRLTTSKGTTILDVTETLTFRTQECSCPLAEFDW